MAARTFLDQQVLKGGAGVSASLTDTAERHGAASHRWQGGPRGAGGGAALTFTFLHNPQDNFLELFKIFLQPERNVSYL